MLLLISDANILIDMEVGALMPTLFALPFQFAIPDILYWEEIEPGTPGLEDLGLRVLENAYQRKSGSYSYMDAPGMPRCLAITA